MKKLSKRFGGLFLALVMVLAMLPTGALAADVEVGSVDALTAAINGATGETTIVLTDNIVASSTITIGTGKEIILDLNGHTLSYANGVVVQVASGGTLVINDAAGTGGITAGSNTAIINEGTTTINNGNYKRANTSGTRYVIENKVNATMYINGGIFTNESTGGVTTVQNNGTMYVSGNTQISAALSSGSAAIALKNDEEGTLTVTGGTFNGQGDQAIQNWNEATISDGSLVNGGVATWTYTSGGTTYSGNTTINGGEVDRVSILTYLGSTPDSDALPQVNISGNAQVGTVTFIHSSDSQPMSGTYGIFNITGGTVGSVSNAADHGIITIDNSVITGNVSNTGSGTTTVLNSTVDGNVSGAIAVNSTISGNYTPPLM